MRGKVLRGVRALRGYVPAFGSVRPKRSEPQGRQQAATSAACTRRKPARRRETARSERDPGHGSPGPKVATPGIVDVCSSAHRGGEPESAAQVVGFGWSTEGWKRSAASRGAVDSNPRRGRSRVAFAHESVRARGEGSGEEPKARRVAVDAVTAVIVRQRSETEDLEDPSRGSGNQPRHER